MNEYNSESPKEWNIYTSSDPSPPQTPPNRDGPWKNFGTSMDAISFGFVATAILISMFLIMAIFEHLFKPSSSFSSTQDGTDSSLDPMQKRGGSPRVPISYSSNFSVVMPGQQYPSFIAQPAPLPCNREGVYWPSHEHKFNFP